MWLLHFLGLCETFTLFNTSKDWLHLIPESGLYPQTQFEQIFAAHTKNGPGHQSLLDLRLAVRLGNMRKVRFLIRTGMAQLESSDVLELLITALCYNHNTLVLYFLSFTSTHLNMLWRSLSGPDKQVQAQYLMGYNKVLNCCKSNSAGDTNALTSVVLDYEIIDTLLQCSFFHGNLPAVLALSINLFGLMQDLDLGAMRDLFQKAKTDELLYLAYFAAILHHFKRRCGLLIDILIPDIIRVIEMQCCHFFLRDLDLMPSPYKVL